MPPSSQNLDEIASTATLIVRRVLIHGNPRKPRQNLTPVTPFQKGWFLRQSEPSTTSSSRSVALTPRALPTIIREPDPLLRLEARWRSPECPDRRWPLWTDRFR